MSDLKQLETRIERAFGRIEAALDGGAAQTEPGELAEANRAQAEEIAALREKLAAIQEERRRDADDVTAILADLRPMLER